VLLVGGRTLTVCRDVNPKLTSAMDVEVLGKRRAK